MRARDAGTPPRELRATNMEVRYEGRKQSKQQRKPTPASCYSDSACNSRGVPDTLHLRVPASSQPIRNTPYRPALEIARAAANPREPDPSLPPAWRVGALMSSAAPAPSGPGGGDQ